MDLSTPSHKFKEIIQMYNSTCTDESDKLPDLSLHALRHTSISVQIAEGVDISTVSRRAGHSKTSVTLNIYAHALKKVDSTASDTLESTFNRKKA